MINLSLDKRKKRMGEEGYILVYVPEHPKSFNGWYYEHRVVIEQNINRFLNKWETVHHINGNKQDNRIKNLFVCVEYQHKKAHNS
jgi:hypothetical protein